MQHVSNTKLVGKLQPPFFKTENRLAQATCKRAMNKPPGQMKGVFQLTKNILKSIYVVKFLCFSISPRYEPQSLIAQLEPTKMFQKSTNEAYIIEF